MHLTWSKHIVSLVHDMSLHFWVLKFFFQERVSSFQTCAKSSHCFIVTWFIEHSKPFLEWNVVWWQMEANLSKAFHYFGIPRHTSYKHVIPSVVDTTRVLVHANQWVGMNFPPSEIGFPWGTIMSSRRSLSCFGEQFKPFFPLETIMSPREKEHFSLGNLGPSQRKIHYSLWKSYFSSGNFSNYIGNLFATDT
jgi:hypothetical protein